MADQQYEESNYRFTDPIRFFKANDPYYFEVDNIPLKQLQENCLWLKDQVRKDTTIKLKNVKRIDIDELRPYATGADRVVRVKPGRYTSRINDASTREPLAYLRKVMGEAIGDVDAWSAATPNPGDFPGDKNAALGAALDKFKENLAENALGMNGLVERAFTWPVINSDTPIDNDGANLDTTKSWLSFGGEDVNIPGGGAASSPFPITEAITWAKSQDSAVSEVALPSFEITSTNGWASFPLTESYFIKAWRGVSRLAIVDVDDEITIEVPKFDPTDFSYTGEDGQSVDVNGVTQRIDLVFIYSKPIDASGVDTIQNGSVERITRPALGIVKGAGIKTSFEEKTFDFADGYKVNTNDSILAAPGDQSNVNMGFNSTSANDIAYPIRGSFPAPDDLLNLAPLISEKLEDNAYELVGQSILPVAYVFVQESSEVVGNTDVIDIRPLFRTAELTYNERAGIGAAFPQLSLANPAVGKGQLDQELRRVYSDVKAQFAAQNNVISEIKTNPLAIGYVFGGFNFGAEGALYDFYRKEFAADTTDNDSVQYIKDYVKSKYGLASTNITIPDYPDWDLAKWCLLQDLDNKGYCPNDYINTFISTDPDSTGSDNSIAAGSYKDPVTPEGTTLNGGTPTRINKFSAATTGGVPDMIYHYISKTIKFNRPANLIDYEVDFKLINCIAQMQNGGTPNSSDRALSFGSWVEKGYDEFTIYISFNVTNNVPYKNKTSLPQFPSPDPGWDLSNESGRTDGSRFSGFSVLTNDILYSNTAPVATGGAGLGYVGNPRVGKCTYPTVMWKMTGFTQEKDAGFLYGNLNEVNPTINIKA